MAQLKPFQYLTSLSQFIELVEEMRGGGSGKGWIFRGQTKLRKDWPLKPKIGRSEFWESRLAKSYGWTDAETTHSDESGKVVTTPMPDFYAPPDIYMFEDWCDKAIAAQSLPDNHWERLALAQHYGLATRLLDWTENPLAALFFAALGGEDLGWYGGVYAFLRPDVVTKDASFAECGRAHFPEKDVLSSMFGRPSRFQFSKVLTYVPRPFDRRMLQQSAVFTYHVQPAVAIEPTPVCKDPPEGAESWKMTSNAQAMDVGLDLIEFIVAPEYKDPFLRGLASLGIRYDTLFPDLDGLSRQLNREIRPRLTVRTQGIPVEDEKVKPPKSE
jgi:hypothetical protein